MIALLLVAAVAADAAPAPAGDVPDVTIHLLSMEPGVEFPTRGGHIAILVTKTWAVGDPVTRVYNYGDTDFDDPRLVWNFLRGQLVFFLSMSGTLEETITTYGVNQARTIYRQRLAYTPVQARAFADRLEREALPEHRNYIFHQTRALCSSKARDALDEAAGGIIRAQLEGLPDPLTVRDYEQWTFSGFFWASLGGDLLMGRMHDTPIDQYFAGYVPYRLRDYLQQVQVPDPWGSGALVPFAGPPIEVVVRETPLPERGPNLSAPVAGGGLALVLLVLGLLGAWRGGRDRRYVAVTLAVWGLVSGLLGVSLVAVLVLSAVREFWLNELLLTFWATDLTVLVPAWQWRRGQGAVPRWLGRYLTVRLVAAGLVLLGHLAGILYQRPYWWLAAGLVGTLLAWLVVWRLERQAPDVAAPVGLTASSSPRG